MLFAICIFCNFLNSCKMKVLKKRCFRKLLNSGILSTSGLLVAQDLWLSKDARKGIKIKRAELEPPHLTIISFGAFSVFEKIL